MTTKDSGYGYGHTKEAAAIVRTTLKTALANEIKAYGLVISVRKADSSYGGPRVHITTSHDDFADYYEYIVDEDGNVTDSGKLVRTKTTATHSWDQRMQLRRAREHNKVAKAVHEKITSALAQFGHDNDDAMTDYFDNTSPLFYGVDFKETKNVQA